MVVRHRYGACRNCSQTCNFLEGKNRISEGYASVEQKAAAAAAAAAGGGTVVEKIG